MFWQHKITEREINPIKLNRRYCVYCKTGLEQIVIPNSKECNNSIIFHTCRACGWWWLKQKEDWGAGHWYLQGTHATLLELDLTDISLPIDTIRRYLIANFDSRYLID